MSTLEWEYANILTSRFFTFRIENNIFYMMENFHFQLIGLFLDTWYNVHMIFITHLAAFTCDDAIVDPTRFVTTDFAGDDLNLC